MKLVYHGKTKDVFELADGTFQLRFRDDATGSGGVFDPGANTVGLQIRGLGLAGLALSVHFFTLLQDLGVATHYLSADLEAGTMNVLAAEPFGRGLEVICRYRAAGSFVRRYGAYVAEGAPLDALVEFTIKDDERGDPPATRDTLLALGILSAEQHDELLERTVMISAAIRAELAAASLDLIDIKLEFGLAEGRIVLMDELSAGNMRVLRAGEPVAPLELTSLVTAAR
jgi:phosphoribosylaminoimidazole-succinocarboxamide synthase